MAGFWNTLRSEVMGTVDDFRTKGVIGAVRDAALDTADVAQGAGTWLWEGVRSAVAEGDPSREPILRSEAIPVRGAPVQLELPNGTVVTALVVDVDGVSTPPRARVTVPGRPEPLLVTILPPLAPGEAEAAAAQQAAASSREAGDAAGGAAEATAGPAAGGAMLFQTIRDEFSATVQDFREKGAVSTVKELGLDAVDMVGAAASTAVEGAKILGQDLIDLTREQPGESTAAAPGPGQGAAAVSSSSSRGAGDAARSADGDEATQVDPDSPGRDAAAQTEPNVYGADLLETFKQECFATVQDFREKGAVSAVKDAALDAVDIVGSTASTIAVGARSVATPLLDRTGSVASNLVSNLPDLWAPEQQPSSNDVGGGGSASSSAQVPPTTDLPAAPKFSGPEAFSLTAADSPAAADSPTSPASGSEEKSLSGASAAEGKPSGKKGKSLVELRRNQFEKPKEELVD